MSSMKAVDHTMVLNEDELRWAHDIKNAIEESPDLQPVSDLEYAQWAIVTMADRNLEEVLERAYRLQCFREQYKFDNVTSQTTPQQLTRVWEEGVELLRRYIQEQQPGHLVTIDHMENQGHYLIVWDRAAFQPSKVKLEEDWRVYQGCTYAIFLILNSNIRAIREGIAVILECEGMGYLNYDSQFEERRVNELFNYYPFKTQEFFFLHTPTVAIFLYKAVKPFLTKSFHSTVQLDAKVDGLEGKRIDTLFNMPTFEEAQVRLLIRLGEYLKQRLEHQRDYKLPPPPAAAAAAAAATQGADQMATDPALLPGNSQDAQDEFAAAMAEFGSEFDEEFSDYEEE